MEEMKNRTDSWTRRYWNRRYRDSWRGGPGKGSVPTIVEQKARYLNNIISLIH